MANRVISYLKTISARERLAIIIDTALVISIVSLFFIYSSFEQLAVGVVLSILAFVDFLYREIVKHSPSIKLSKNMFIFKDFVFILFIAFIAGLIILVTKSYMIQYNKYLAFPIIFVFYILYVFLFDLTL